MKSTLLSFLMVLFFCQHLHAQELMDLEYNKETRSFHLLSNYNNWSCETRGVTRYILSTFSFPRPIQNVQNIYYTGQGALLNEFDDSAFIYANDLLIPDTVSCNADTTNCILSNQF